MISAVFSKDADGTIKSIEVSGHAGYAKAGKDIICAAVSAIMYAAAGSLEDLADCRGCSCINNGDMVINIGNMILNTTCSRKAQTILEMAEIGLKQIELTYGSKYIKVE